MVFLFKALQQLEASEVTILSTLRVIVTIIASIIFLQETFNEQKILGAITIIVATILVTNLKKGFKVNKGVIYVLLMSLFSGIAIVFDSLSVKHYNVFWYDSLQNFLSGFIVLTFYPKALKQRKHFTQPKVFRYMLLLVVLSAGQGISYLFALTTPGVTAQASSIRQASVIVTVVLAVIFLNEKDHLMRKIIAALLVTFGIFLLS